MKKFIFVFRAVILSIIFLGHLALGSAQEVFDGYDGPEDPRNFSNAFPEKAPFHPECSIDTIARWVGVVPHTPLAIVEGHDIRSAGQKCCEPWGQKGSNWTVVDRNGQKIDQATLIDGSWYDVTSCFDYEFQLKSSTKPDVLFVFQKKEYVNPPNAMWVPNREQKDSLVKIEKSMVKADHREMVRRNEQERRREYPEVPRSPFTPLIPCENLGDVSEKYPMKKRPRFFQFTLQGVTRYFAVTSGLRLHVYELLNTHRWVHMYASSIDLEEIQVGDCSWEQPWAIFDMDQDGVPEIIFHKVDFDWGSSVLRFEPKTNHWKVVAVGITDSTV